MTVTLWWLLVFNRFERFRSFKPPAVPVVYDLRDKYEHKEIVAGISLSNGVDPGCFYSYEGNESVELLWVNKDKKRRFEKLKTNKPYVYRTIMYKNGEKEVDNKKIIEFIKIETFIAVNNPEKWRVILWYKDIK